MKVPRCHPAWIEGRLWLALLLAALLLPTAALSAAVPQVPTRSEQARRVLVLEDVTISGNGQARTSGLWSGYPHIHEAAITESTLTVTERITPPGRRPLLDLRYQFEFTRPPERIEPGTTIPVQVRGTISGHIRARSPFEWVNYMAGHDANRQIARVSMGKGDLEYEQISERQSHEDKWHYFGEGTSTSSGEVRVPSNPGDDFAIRIRTKTGLSVRWDYELVEASADIPPTPPRTDPDPPAPDPSEDREPEVAVTILDGNPTLYPDSTTQLSVNSLVEEGIERRGTVADGVSRLVILVRSDGPGSVTFSSLDPSLGTIRALGDGTLRNYGADDLWLARGMYTPPEALPATASRNVELPRSPLTAARVAFRTTVRASDSDATTGLDHAFFLARPPVVLVHGTFSGPEVWSARSNREAPASSWLGSGGNPPGGMKGYLESRGFRVSALDYSGSNGMSDSAPSSLADNARVIWAAPGGIKETLEELREELGLAATKVDVVGHSLGGLLARTWASEASEGYNPDGYRRAENFGAGDIRRLIALATPHFGADSADALVELEDAAWSEAAWTAIRRVFDAATGRFDRLARLDATTTYALLSMVGVTPTGAVLDQRPYFPDCTDPDCTNEALARIGPTPIPAHAIVLTSSPRNLSDFASGMRETLLGTDYELIYAKLFDFFSERPQRMVQFLERRGLARRAEDLFHALGYLNSESWLTSDGDPDPAQRLRLRDHALLKSLVNAAIFANTQNDMVVRVESQIGGLPLQHTTHVPDAVHGHGPRYARVQETVAELLAGPASRFAPDGFPRTDRVMLPGELEEISQPAEARAAVFAAAGIVPRHGEAIAGVAKRKKRTILVRPVNHHATRLIQENRATKDMFVKGKSSSWGPQAGYIPVEQRFSKLFCTQEGRDEIPEYDGKVQESREEGNALFGPLTVTAGGSEYDVKIVTARAGVEQAAEAIVLEDDSGRTWHWRTDGSGFDPNRPPSQEVTGIDETREFLVLADPRPPNRLLTADYDLLAAARLESNPPSSDTCSPPGNNHPQMGFILPWQQDLVGEINNAVRVQGNYVGGNVVHHGPEQFFPNSPGPDYPITVFEPSGLVLSISEGPRGAQDLHLKRYFHRKMRVNWSLCANPVWKWGEYGQGGWPPQDQAPEPNDETADIAHDSDQGDEACPLLGSGR